MNIVMIKRRDCGCRDRTIICYVTVTSYIGQRCRYFLGTFKDIMIVARGVPESVNHHK